MNLHVDLKDSWVIPSPAAGWVGGSSETGCKGHVDGEIPSGQGLYTINRAGAQLMAWRIWPTNLASKGHLSPPDSLFR